VVSSSVHSITQASLTRRPQQGVATTARSPTWCAKTVDTGTELVACVLRPYCGVAERHKEEAISPCSHQLAVGPPLSLALAGA